MILQDFLERKCLLTPEIVIVWSSLHGKSFLSQRSLRPAWVQECTAPQVGPKIITSLAENHTPGWQLSRPGHLTPENALSGSVRPGWFVLGE